MEFVYKNLLIVQESEPNPSGKAVACPQGCVLCWPYPDYLDASYDVMVHALLIWAVRYSGAGPDASVRYRK